MIRGSQLGRTAKTAGTGVTRIPRVSARVSRRPAAPIPKRAAKPETPSAFNHLKLNGPKMGKYVSNIPQSFAEAVRNRQLSYLFGLNEKREHRLLKRAARRQLARKLVPKKKKSPVNPFQERPLHITLLKPNAKVNPFQGRPLHSIILKPTVNLFQDATFTDIISSIISQNNTVRKMLRRSLAIPKTKAKYFGSLSADPSRSVARRYSKIGKLKVHKQERQAASV